MKKKLVWLILIVVILGLGIWGGMKYKDYKHWAAPKFNDTDSKVLLSSKVDELNDDQEEAFYSIAKGAITGENPDIKFTNLEDSSLYVEKLSKKKTYYISYVCEFPTLSMKFNTDVKIKLKNESLKGDTPFEYWDYNSDIDDLADY